MMTKRQAAREARRIFHYCFVDGILDELRVRQVVQTILKSRRRGYLVLLGYFQRLVKLDYLQHLAKVESAVPVPADVQENVAKGLVSKYGPGLTTEFSLRPALIGGMRIQVGSDVYDGSVLHGLEELQQSLGIGITNGRTNRSQGRSND